MGLHFSKELYLLTTEFATPSDGKDSKDGKSAAGDTAIEKNGSVATNGSGGVKGSSMVDRTVSRMQRKLLDKHGFNGIPFKLRLAADIPQTVVLLTDNKTEKPCGVYYSIKVFTKMANGKPDKRQVFLRLPMIS